MLDLGRYLLGVAELTLLVGFAWLGASILRSRLIPTLSGLPSHLATAVLALALLIWVAELLGTFGAFEPLPYVVAVGVVCVSIATLLPRVAWGMGGRGRPRLQRPPSPATGPAGRGVGLTTLIAVPIAVVAVIKFGVDVGAQLGTGMTGFDSTWYHGPFAAGFFQSGDTWSLHFIAPQFLAWFYPANAEIAHGIGMLAFERDLISPLLNLGWLIGCLAAAWCIGRPYRVAPASLALGAIALSVPAFADQAGEARNDIVGTFFMLAAVAVALNAWTTRHGGESGLAPGALAVVGLAAGLAAGTKLNFLVPASVLLVGLTVLAGRGARLRALAISGLAAIAGGGYWYLRNLAHTGNPLPWLKDLGPLSVPAPDQALGGREGHTVLGYVGDGSVWADWLFPGLRDGLWVIWPLLLALAFAGLLLNLRARAAPLLRVAGLTGLAALLAWLFAPTSASGPEGMPRGFESGLRYLVPALVLGLALLPAAPALRNRLARLTTLRPTSPLFADSASKGELTGWGGGYGRLATGMAIVLVSLAIVAGYPIQRHYLEGRYSDPSFTTPGLNAAFAWAGSVSDSRIATTSTRQYPLYGTDLSNRVEFVGIERPHGGFVAPRNCRTWRRLLNEGGYDYVVASRDRIEPGKRAFPATARWTESPAATVILRKPPTVVFELSGPLDPSAC
ncbi:MAG TPA: hypothetical protein VFZ41_02405 [Solirubrobacterales bacterium]